jgi:hypothetical protein
MPSRTLFSEAEMARLDSFPPDIESADLARFFTLSLEERAFALSRRGAAHRLGAALQIGALRFLGFMPASLASASPEAIAFAASQLGLSPEPLNDYGQRRGQTRSDHFDLIRQLLGFSNPTPLDLVELGVSGRFGEKYTLFCAQSFEGTFLAVTRPIGLGEVRRT